MTEYTIRFSADFGYADGRIEAETPEHALEKACAMPEEDLSFERYDGYGDIEEIEVFEDGEALAEDSAAFWLSAAKRLRIAAPALLEALHAARAFVQHELVLRPWACDPPTMEAAQATLAVIDAALARTTDHAEGAP